MARKKSKKLEKETRRLVEGIADLTKKRSDGTYKFRTKKKKVIRRIKTTCVHWTISKGREVPTVTQDNENPNNWRCVICGATFPIRPFKKVEDHHILVDRLLADINQFQFWGVKMGGDAEDTKMFLKLKTLLPRYRKVQRNIYKQVNKRQEFEDRKSHTDSLSQFDSYTGFNYRS